MAQRQHKFIEETTNEIIYFHIEYTDETDYQNKVKAIVDANKDVVIDSEQERETEDPHYALEDTGEYEELWI